MQKISLDYIQKDIVNYTTTELVEFKDIWLQCFLSTLVSSIVVYTIAAAVAFGRLRKHMWGKVLPIIIFILGFLTPLTYGVLTNVAITAIYRASDFSMLKFHAIIWGIGQTLFVLGVSFTRLLVTL